MIGRRLVSAASPFQAMRRTSVAMRRTVLAMSLTVLATWLTGCDDAAELRLERARDLAFEGRHEPAAEEYRLLLSELGDRRDAKSTRLRAQALLALADLAWLRLADPPGAAALYRKVILEAPASEESWIARERLGDVAELKLRDLHEAIAQWQALAGSGRPGADAFAYKVARGYFELHDFAQCRKECEALAQNFPSGPWVDDAIFLAATASQFEGQHEAAIAGFERAIRNAQEPAMAARARFQIGQSLSTLGRLQESLDMLLAALADHPDPQRVQPEIQRLRRLLTESETPKVGDRLAAFGQPIGPGGALVVPVARRKPEPATGAGGAGAPEPPPAPTAPAPAAPESAAP